MTNSASWSKRARGVRLRGLDWLCVLQACERLCTHSVNARATRECAGVLRVQVGGQSRRSQACAGSKGAVRCGRRTDAQARAYDCRQPVAVCTRCAYGTLERCLLIRRSHALACVCQAFARCELAGACGSLREPAGTCVSLTSTGQFQSKADWARGGSACAAV